MRKMFFILISILVATVGLYAGAGTVSGQFLKLGSGGRGAALGNAFTGITGEAMSVYYNPAGILFTDKKQVSLMYSTYLEEISYQNAVFSMPLGDSLGLGVGITMLSYGKIAGYSELGVATNKDVPASDLAANIAAGYKLSDKLGLGVTLKYISETLDDKVASTPSLDIGAVYKMDKLSLGFSAQNLIGSLTFITKEEKIPMIIKAGAAFSAMDNLLVLADVNSLDSGIAVGAGVEFLPIDLLAIRVGYGMNTAVTGLGGMNGLTAGVGINLSKFGLDIAYVPYGNLGDAIKVGLSAKF